MTTPLDAHPHPLPAWFYCPPCDLSFRVTRFVWAERDNLIPQPIFVTCRQCKRLYQFGVVQCEPPAANQAPAPERHPDSDSDQI